MADQGKHKGHASPSVQLFFILIMFYFIPSVVATPLVSVITSVIQIVNNVSTHYHPHTKLREGSVLHVSACSWRGLLAWGHA